MTAGQRDTGDPVALNDLFDRALTYLWLAFSSAATATTASRVHSCWTGN